MTEKWVLEIIKNVISEATKSHNYFPALHFFVMTFFKNWRHDLYYSLLFLGVELALTRGNQVGQAAVDVGATVPRAGAIAFVGGDKIHARKAIFGLAALPGEFKSNTGVPPPALVLYEVNVVVQTTILPGTSLVILMVQW